MDIEQVFDAGCALLIILAGIALLLIPVAILIFIVLHW